MPNVSFSIVADAAKGVQEFERLRTAEKKVGDELKEVAANAKAAGGAMSAAAREGLREMQAFERAAASQSKMTFTGAGAGRTFSRARVGAGAFVGMDRALAMGGASLAAGRSRDDEAFKAFISERNAGIANEAKRAELAQTISMNNLATRQGIKDKNAADFTQGATLFGVAAAADKIDAAATRMQSVFGGPGEKDTNAHN